MRRVCDDPREAALFRRLLDLDLDVCNQERAARPVPFGTRYNIEFP